MFVEPQNWFLICDIEPRKNSRSNGVSSHAPFAIKSANFIGIIRSEDFWATALVPHLRPSKKLEWNPFTEEERRL